MKQVIAIEDKNAWRSIEFNRSPNITFRTSDPEVFMQPVQRLQSQSLILG